MSKKVSLILGYAEKIEQSMVSSGPSTSASINLTAIRSKSQTWSNAPVIWERTTTGYRIVDLHDDLINSALDLISRHFFLEEPLCSATSLSKDVVSSESYRQLVMTKLVEGTSICAIHEGKGSFVGVAVMSTCRQTVKEYQDVQGAALSVIMRLEKQLFTEMQLDDKLDDVDEYFEINVLYVMPDHRGKGVGSALLRSCIAKTRSLDVSACIGVFSSNTSQRIARRLGFETLGEVPYATYIAEISQDNPFAAIAAGNHCLACMGVRTKM